MTMGSVEQDSEKKTQILAALRRIEDQSECRVIFAAISGSRAWGFASPDSDYDICGIYSKPLAWYLRISTTPVDTIDMNAPDDDLDISIWELRKVLRLFAEGNAMMYERLASPWVFAADEDFFKRAMELLPRYFNKKKALHYFLSLGDKAEKGLAAGRVPLTDLFYALRGVLSADWCGRVGTLPPVTIDGLLSLDILPMALRGEVTELLVRKRTGTESAGRGSAEAVSAALGHYLLDRRVELKTIALAMKSPERPLEFELDQIFREMVFAY